VSTNRKGNSPTQPGWGIHKIIDLYHDLPDLVEKANKHLPNNLQSEMQENDKVEFSGMSEEAIEDECKEYVSCPLINLRPCDLGVTHHDLVTPAVSVATQLSNSSTC
jgi:hypothetical protein